MRRPAGSLRRASAAAAAFLLLVLVLVSLVAEGGAMAAPVVGVAPVRGRRMALEDTRAGDQFLGSKRKVPNGPDPIHNRGTGKSGRSPGRA